MVGIDIAETLGEDTTKLRGLIIELGGDPIACGVTAFVASKSDYMPAAKKSIRH
jgi:hypothetical protein